MKPTLSGPQYLETQHNFCLFYDKCRVHDIGNPNVTLALCCSFFIQFTTRHCVHTKLKGCVKTNKNRKSWLSDFQAVLCTVGVRTIVTVV